MQEIVNNDIEYFLSFSLFKSCIILTLSCENHVTILTVYKRINNQKNSKCNFTKNLQGPMHICKVLFNDKWYCQN